MRFIEKAVNDQLDGSDSTFTQELVLTTEEIVDILKTVLLPNYVSLTYIYTIGFDLDDRVWYTGILKT